jgi:hypothetical protein
MRFCKVKTTGQIIETQSGGGDLEMFYGNNSAYSRDELEVGIADDEVVSGWLSEQAEQAKTYSDHRVSSYPSIPDQLDMLWHAIDLDTLDKTSDFYNNLKAVKDKYPKGDN